MAKRWRARLLPCLALIALAGPAAAGCGGPRAGRRAALDRYSSIGDPAVRDFVRLLEGARAQAGCPPLTWDPRAAAVAQAHSTDMLRRNYLGHTSPEGVGPFERLRQAGVSYSAAAENIAAGPRTGSQAFRQWNDSPRHRENMLNCALTRHGAGRAGDRWTQVLFAP